ncbi:unnamed protein product, partial [Soboliphyme baturini]|uniref:Ribosomal RNA-processing protein 43 n=1 Tax=Soboliphyme baturini TaxID=241478 RepID=A0A183IRF7_9BILA
VQRFVDDVTRHLKLLEPHKFHRKLIVDEGVHVDGRKLREFRKTLLRRGVISSADGSALVRHGGTSIMCGVKAELAEPSLMEPKRGRVSISFGSSINLSDYETAQLEEATEILLNLADRCVLDSRQLCVEPGKVCWVLYCDLLLMDCSGAVLDIALTALMSALGNTSLPQVRPRDEELHSRLVSSTFLLCENNLIVCDPTQEESELVDGSLLSIVVGDGGQLCGLYKFGGAFTATESVLSECIGIACKRQQKLVIADS